MTSQPYWLPSGDFEPTRYRPGGVGNWSGHLPFAYDLVSVVQPQLLVELGTHYGESYFGFCQTVAQQRSSCTCYAVDTWVGESQSGFYDESVYQDVFAYNESHYKHFSYLLRMTFDDAAANFADASIDILHIDGLHTYEAVSHDFYTWLPKVRPGGVVLLHDVVAHHADFGVWKLWEELSPLGDRFLFPHSWGLGVFRKNRAANEAGEDALSRLFEAEPAYQSHLKKFYALSATNLEYRHQRDHSGHQGQAGLVDAQIFPKVGGEYSLSYCIGASFPTGKWHKVRVEISAGMEGGSLRADLAQKPGLIDVAGITLRKAVQDEVIWKVVGSEAATLPVGGDMRFLGASPDRAFARFLSVGNDPQLFLPESPEGLDEPLYLQLWVRVITEPGEIINQLARINRDELQELGTASTAISESPERSSDKSPEASRKEPDKLVFQIEKLKEDNALLLEKLEAAGKELEASKTWSQQIQRELYVARTDLRIAREECQAAQGRLEDHSGAVQAKLDEMEKALGLEQMKYDEVVHARNIGAERSKLLNDTLQQMTNSRSWRITAPLRRKRNI